MVGAGAAAWSMTVEQSYGLKEKEMVWLCHQGSPGPRALMQEGGGSLMGRRFCGYVLQLCLQRKQCFFLDFGEVLVKITENELKPTPCFQQTTPWCCHRSK